MHTWEITLKKCKSCDEWKEEDNFEKHRAICKTCRSKQKLARVNEIRELYYNHLLGCKCSVCGERNPLVLQFHHIGDDKDFGISEMINQGHSWKNIKKELGKTVCLCANHHSIVTVVEADAYKANRFPEFICDDALLLANI